MSSTTVISKLITAITLGSSALRGELTALLTECDESCLQTVMGPGVIEDARLSPTDLQVLVKSDAGLSATLAEHSNARETHVAVRKLLEAYGDQVAKGAVSNFKKLCTASLVVPANARAVTGIKILGQIEQLSKDLQNAALRMPGNGANDSASKLVEEAYKANIEFVEEAAAQMASFDIKIAEITREISVAMAAAVGTATGIADTATYKSLQETRTFLEKEREYSEKSLTKHFEAGMKSQCGGVKLSLTPLVIPQNLKAGKGAELIQNIKAHLNLRAPFYYAIMPELIKTMADAMLGRYHKPPSKADGYATVNVLYRDAYDRMAQTIYDEFESKLPQEILLDVRKEFRFGELEEKAVCTKGDGPMLVFCLLALYKPNDVHFRQKLKVKMQGAPQKFRDGACPKTKVLELQPILNEVLDLGVKIQWAETGKLICSILSERSNTFAAVLKHYNEPGAIVDPDDCAVELNRMFTDIEQACKDLEEAGVGYKQSHTNAISTYTTTIAETDCWFGLDCTRKECERKHPTGQREFKTGKGGGGKGGGKGGGGKAQGKGGGRPKGDRQGKGADRQGKGSKTCQGKGCNQSCRGFRFCTTCHRKGLSEGSITLKDGSKAQIEDKGKGSQEKRICQLEKMLQDKDDCQDDDELWNGVKPGNKRAHSAQGAEAADDAAERATKRVMVEAGKGRGKGNH